MTDYSNAVPQDWSVIVGELHMASGQKVKHDAGEFTYAYTTYTDGRTVQVFFDPCMKLANRFEFFKIVLTPPDGETEYVLLFHNQRADGYLNIRLKDALYLLWEYASKGKSVGDAYTVYTRYKGALPDA